MAERERERERRTRYGSEGREKLLKPAVKAEEMTPLPLRSTITGRHYAIQCRKRQPGYPVRSVIDIGGDRRPAAPAFYPATRHLKSRHASQPTTYQIPNTAEMDKYLPCVNAASSHLRTMPVP